jgi:hypothetical protein
MNNCLLFTGVVLLLLCSYQRAWGTGIDVFFQFIQVRHATTTSVRWRVNEGIHILYYFNYQCITAWKYEISSSFHRNPLLISSYHNGKSRRVLVLWTMVRCREEMTKFEAPVRLHSKCIQKSTTIFHDLLHHTPNPEGVTCKWSAVGSHRHINGWQGQSSSYVEVTNIGARNTQ